MAGGGVMFVPEKIKDKQPKEAAKKTSGKANDNKSKAQQKPLTGNAK